MKGWTTRLGRSRPLWVALGIFLAVTAIFLLGIAVDRVIDKSHPLANHILTIFIISSYLLTLLVWIMHLRRHQKVSLGQ